MRRARVAPLIRMKAIEPNPKQIKNSAYLGWEYIGDYLFARDGEIGYFTDQGFYKS